MTETSRKEMNERIKVLELAMSDSAVIILRIGKERDRLRNCIRQLYKDPMNIMSTFSLDEILQIKELS